MGFFSKLFGKKQAEETPAVTNDEQTPSSATCMLLFDKVPKFSDTLLDVTFKLLFQSEMTSYEYKYEDDVLLIIAKFGDDEVIITLLNMPYPKQVLDRILPVCHFDKETKQTFYNSQAHMIFIYKSETTPIFIRYDRIFAFAQMMATITDGAIGIVNEAAWTVMPERMFEKVAAEQEELYKQQSMPFMTWTLWTGGFVKYIVDNNTVWYITKGHHLFGIPELAFKGSPQQGEFAIRVFNAFFSYLYFYHAKFNYGHTAELGGMNFRIKKPYEYPEIFESKTPTLVLEVK